MVSREEEAMSVLYAIVLEELFANIKCISKFDVAIVTRGPPLTSLALTPPTFIYLTTGLLIKKYETIKKEESAKITLLFFCLIKVF